MGLRRWRPSTERKQNVQRPLALVTGSSRGIGRGIAVSLAEAGYDIVVNYQGNHEAAVTAAEECKSHGVRAETVQADIAVREDRLRLVEETRSRFGRLDVLVNNAGVTVAQRTDLLEATEESYDRLMGINLRGTHFLTQQAAKWMVEQVVQDPSRKPVIVTISSAAAAAALVNRSEYSMSKAAIRMMTLLYAARLGGSGIGVFEVRPGVIETDITTQYRADWDKFVQSGAVPMRRWGEPRDVGRAVVALASGQFAFSSGDVVNVDGGLHVPRF